MNDVRLDDFRAELEVIWDALVRRDELPAQVDAIVVGGCRDLGLAERAAELYHASVSGLIFVTGYQQKAMDATEAKYLANKCIELGVPEKALVLEERASNTGENIQFAAKLVDEKLGHVKSVILVHKPYMSLRFFATAEAQWPQPQPDFYATCQKISFDEYCRVHGFEDTAWKMLGDLKRMDMYVAEGYQTPQEISQAAKDAYEKIVARGFIAR